MKIKEFVEGYMNYTDSLKGEYLEENIKIVNYLPFLKKNVLAQKIVEVTTYQFENYTKEDETIGRRKTNKIHINSTSQTLLFYRVLIENYTNLEIETEGFYEEYDLLNESGLLEELVLNYEGHPSLIPAKEIEELRTMVKMKQDDILFNYSNPQNYISEQIERITEVGSVILRPVLDKLAIELENLDDAKVNKIVKTLEKIKRVK